MPTSAQLGLPMCSYLSLEVISKCRLLPIAFSLMCDVKRMKALTETRTPADHILPGPQKLSHARAPRIVSGLGPRTQDEAHRASVTGLQTARPSW